MKSMPKIVSQVAAQQRNGQIQASPESPKALNAEAAKNVNDIFRALQAAFPAWRQAFPDDASLKAAKASWVKGLVAAGVTDFKQISRGVEKARLSESDFFPSVGRFVGWCRLEPEDIGLPSEDLAWREACQHSHHVLAHSWSHPGIYEAGRRTGWFAIRNCSGDREVRTLRKTFTDQYATVLRELEAGKEFSVPAADSARLENHNNGSRVVTEQSRRAGRAAIASLRVELGL